MPLPGHTQQTPLIDLQSTLTLAADSTDKRYWFLVLSKLIPDCTFEINGRRFRLDASDDLCVQCLTITNLESAELKESTRTFELFVETRPVPQTTLECYEKDETTGNMMKHTVSFDEFVVCVLEWACLTKQLAVEFLIRFYYALPHEILQQVTTKA